MDANKQKEQFNVAYVKAIAAQAGLNPSIADVDDDSVDLSLVGKGFKGKIRNPQIQLQLKCTSQDIQNEDVLKFRLSRKNYDDLRGNDLLCPRYLVVLVVPLEREAWIQHAENCMQLSHACYWASIRNYPPTNQDTITVEVPLKQRLTATELLNLMQLASSGELT